MSALFAKGCDSLLCARIDWLNGIIRACLISGKPNIETAEFLDDIDVLCSSAPLTGKTVRNGVAGAQGTAFTGVPNRQIDGLVVYQDDGKGRLIALVDEFRSGRLPRTPQGRSIQVVWGADGAIFQIWRPA